MTATLASVEYDVDTDEGRIRRAAERIRSGSRSEAVSRPGKAWTAPELRSEPRYPVATRALLMAARLENGRATQVHPDAAPLPVTALDMSHRGVGIQHDEPVPDRTCLMLFELATGDGAVLLVRHRWFRQEHGGACRYRSGFEILGVAKERPPALVAE